MDKHSFVSREPLQLLGKSDLQILVDTIDWNRVLITASSIHYGKSEAHRDPPAGSGLFPFLDELCGECVHDALLTKEH